MSSHSSASPDAGARLQVSPKSSANTGDPVPTITEDQATGPIADLYDDIRATLAVPVVNLVWRHFATFPGVLEWAWAAVKPLYVSGQVGAAANMLRAQLTLPELPPLPAEALQAIGLTADDQAGIARVLASYDRSNAMNLVALASLQVALEEQPGPVTYPDEARAQSGSAAPVTGTVPSLLAFDQMSPETAALARRLDAIGERDGTIVASMYRQLAHWPAYLAVLHTVLAPLAAGDILFRHIDHNLDQGRALARGLAASRPEPPEQPTPAVRSAILLPLDRFLTHPIGRMTTVCRLIQQIMPR